MNRFLLIVVSVLLNQVVFAANEGELKEGMVNPGYYEKPDWFKQSFLDLRDDLEDANDNNKRIMLYFHQDGCPYCKKLLDVNFSQKTIVQKMKQHYDLLELNMWGDKTITLFNGEEVSEKDFARQMKVMFTPTLIILDQQGAPLFRMNGYYAPDKFTAVLDYHLLPSSAQSSLDQLQKISFNDYYQQHKKNSNLKKRPATGKLHTESFIHKGNNLQELATYSERPVMVLFEQPVCADCDELHGDVFRRLPVYKQLKQFSIAQIDITSEQTIITPNGHTLTQKEFARTQKINYTPSILFYEAGKPEDGVIFRSEAYLKTFHIQALLDYIHDKAYKTEPEFQRYVQRRADHMREQGIEFDLWD